ncbi:MAG: TIGR04255 family protein [Pseudomonadota bacterium]|nr:TIGR04255 family protein [Pseudomonadota bacterium]
MSEVAVGVQFPAVLNPVYLGLYYQRIKARFPKIQVQAPVAPSFETFGDPQIMSFGIAPPLGLQPRMWFMSADENSLIQLQGDRLLFNWRGGVQGSTYPHFEAVYAEFTNALDELETLAAAQGITAIAAAVNQCEVLYVNPLLTANTGVPLSAPEKIFRVWSDKLGVEWQEPLEDMSFNVRYRLNGEDGKPFGRLTAALLSSSSAPNESHGFQLELTARGMPQERGRDGIAAFHNHAHWAIVRCFTALTTPEMHTLWERYQ